MNFKDLISRNPSLDEIVEAYFKTQFTMVDGEVVVDPGLVEGVKEAQAYLDEVVGLSDEEIKSRATAYNAAIAETRSPDSLNRTIIDIKDKIQEVIESIEVNEIPQDNPAADEACFLLDGLFIAVDCCGDFPDLEVLPTLTPKEWFSKEVEAATENLQRKIQFYQIACEKVEETNAALRIIKTHLNG